MGQMLGDQFVMVFDLRMMKLSLPLRALAPPLLLRFVPGLSSCLAVVSPLGQWQLMDAGQPDNAIMSMNYQVSSFLYHTEMFSISFPCSKKIVKESLIPDSRCVIVMLYSRNGGNRGGF